MSDIAAVVLYVGVVTIGVVVAGAGPAGPVVAVGLVSVGAVLFAIGRRFRDDGLWTLGAVLAAGGFVAAFVAAVVDAWAILTGGAA